MAVESRSELKKHFQTGMIPTEGDFRNLMDSFIHRADDGMSKSANSPLQINADTSELKKVIEFFGTSQGDGKVTLRFYDESFPDWSAVNQRQQLQGISIKGSDESGIILNSGSGKIKGTDWNGRKYVGTQTDARLTFDLPKEFKFEYPYSKDKQYSDIMAEYFNDILNSNISFQYQNTITSAKIESKTKYFRIVNAMPRVQSNFTMEASDETDPYNSSASVKIRCESEPVFQKYNFSELQVNPSSIQIESPRFMIRANQGFTSSRLMFSVDNQFISARGAIQSITGGDFAEFLESELEPTIQEGTSVILNDKGKIRPAKTGETPIGIISVNPAILGNSADEWPKKYLRSDFGTPVMEEVEEEVSDSLLSSGIPGNLHTATTRKVKVMRPKLNPDYDPTRDYTPRINRPEWHIVGLLGQIPLRKGQPVAPTWVKIKDISETVELWLVK